LPKFKEGLKFAWRKIQAEVFRYWENSDLSPAKMVLNEDSRLMVGAYVLSQAIGECKDFIPMLYAVQNFVNE